MPKVSTEILNPLLTLARQDGQRKLDWPNDWRPHEVNKPADGQPFTNESAWEFVIRLLEQHADCRSVAQRKPPGSTAYVFHATLSDGWKIYVKVRFSKDRRSIFGRSFHYDESQIPNE
jgi:hypothetical protein